MKHVFRTDLAISLGILMAVLLAYYLKIGDSFSVLVYVKSVGEIFVAPLYPGVRLWFPPALAFVLGILICLSCKPERRPARIALQTALLLGWSCLGLFTIMSWYG